VDNAGTITTEKERCIFCDIIRQERDTVVRKRVIGGKTITSSRSRPRRPRFRLKNVAAAEVHRSAYETTRAAMYSALATC